MIDRAANRRRLDELQATGMDRQARLMQATRWSAEPDGDGGIVVVIRTPLNVLRVPIGGEAARVLADELVLLLNKRSRSDT